jgi:integrase
MEYIWLPMNDTLYESLQWWYRNRECRESDFVWHRRGISNPECEPYSFRKLFMRRLCKRAGIEPAFGYHSLRRYAASILANSGVPMKVIQRILRHKSLATTERYVKFIDDDLQLSIAKLERKDTWDDTQGQKAE